MTEAEKVALNIERDGESGLGVIFGDFADVVGEALLAIEDAFVFAARV